MDVKCVNGNRSTCIGCGGRNKGALEDDQVKFQRHQLSGHKHEQNLGTTHGH